MRNQHIKDLSIPVPVSLRIEIYKMAAAFIVGDTFSFGINTTWNGRPQFPLCLILPCILWNLDEFTDPSPTGAWAFTHTVKAFPELDADIIEEIERSDDANKTRLEYLDAWIFKLQNI